MKYSYILVEKKEQILADLEMQMDIYRDFTFAGEFHTLVEAIEFLKDHTVDVVLMNRSMGDARYSGDASYMCSFWLQQYPNLYTVLYHDTSDSEEYEDSNYAYDSIRSGSRDYFEVPAVPEELQRVISNARAYKELLAYKIHAQNRMILIKTKTGYQLVERNNILFVERTNRKNRLLTADGKEIPLAGYTMDELETLLSECGFYRCYQSFIVNLEKVRAINVNSEKKSYTLQFEGYSGEILLSREKYAEILELLKSQYAKVSL